MNKNTHIYKLMGLMLLLISFAAFFSAGCSGKGEEKESSVQANGQQASQNQEKKLDEVRIPDTYSPTGLYTAYIAEAKGFFKEEGIKGVFTGVIGPGQHVAAVVAGTNDVGTMHVNRTINGIAAGAKIKAVVADSETSKEFPHMEYVVLDNSPLKKPTDIVGKKVGLSAFGGCNEYTPYELLKKYGIADPKGKFEIVLIPPGKEEQTLRDGQVDVVGYHGHPADVFSRGSVRVLFDDYDVWGTVGGATPWYFREDFIKEKPDVVRRFVRAMSKTLDWVNANREEAIKVHADWVKIDPGKVTLMNYAEHGIIKEDSIQVWLDTLKQYGELKKEYTPSDIYTNEFNDYAK